MKLRCYSTNPKWASYKEKGITVCPQWLDSYETFREDMGPAPSPKHSLDRKDNQGPYSPENCRWATDVDQSNNRSDFNHWVTYQGKTQTLKLWCRELGISYHRTHGRMTKGAIMPFEGAIQEDPHQFQITYQGKSQSLKEWAKDLGVSYKTLHTRHSQGWETTRMFEQPFRKSPTKKPITQ